ncbi:MAG TPA: SGNH/GDSL hydrolase family protein [Actinomycetota bacterium]|nr:SGNH/GDSL hydrolase family protein [Actinomycetota bacterium]
MKRALALIGLLLTSIGVTLALQVAITLRRDYLPTVPALDIRGRFGDAGEPLRFVVMGDSTAAGVGAGAIERSYPVLLAERLAGRGQMVELTSLGYSGDRVADVRRDQLPEALNMRPDLVFIGIGANDATHLTPLSSVRDDMEVVLSSLDEAGVAVVVAGAPDMRAAAFPEPLRSIVGWRGDRVTIAIEEVAARFPVEVVPLAVRTRGFFAQDPEEHYADDLFHPGPQGYERWADAIFPYLTSALAGRAEEAS